MNLARPIRPSCQSRRGRNRAPWSGSSSSRRCEYAPLCIYMFAYIYIYMCVCTYIYIYELGSADASELSKQERKEQSAVERFQFFKEVRMCHLYLCK